MITVLAIDQSLKGNTGYAVVQDGELLVSGLVDYRIAKTHTDRLCAFADYLQMLCTTHTPDVVVLERVRQFHQGGINIDTIVLLAELIGVTKFLVRNVLPFSDMWLVNTSSWKAAILEKGWVAKGKAASVDYVQQFYNIQVSDDQADAICMALYGYSHVKTINTSIKNVMMLQE